MCSCYGLILVYSAAYVGRGIPPGFMMQAGACGVGLLAALVISQIDYDFLCRLWPLFALPTLILMGLTFTSLGYNVSGTDDTAWLGFPFGSGRPLFTFQPSELMKILFIMTFSKHLAAVRGKINSPKALLGLCAHGLAPALLVFMQGDDGTALIFLCVCGIMLFSAGLHPLYFLGAGVAAVPVGYLLWRHLDAQKVGRILALIHPEEYLDTYSWQQTNGLTALGLGGLSGVGYLKGGTVAQFARNNDFIFTVAGEEFGFLGSLALLALLLGVILSLLIAAKKARESVGSGICIGMAALIASQSVINLGMNLRLLPVIGITLPFFSAGGSSVLTLYLGIGLALSVCFYSRLNEKTTIFSRGR